MPTQPEDGTTLVADEELTEDGHREGCADYEELIPTIQDAQIEGRILSAELKEARAYLSACPRCGEALRGSTGALRELQKELRAGALDEDPLDREPRADPAPRLPEPAPEAGSRAAWWVEHRGAVLTVLAVACVSVAFAGLAVMGARQCGEPPGSRKKDHTRRSPTPPHRPGPAHDAALPAAPPRPAPAVTPVLAKALPALRSDLGDIERVVKAFGSFVRSLDRDVKRLPAPARRTKKQLAPLLGRLAGLDTDRDKVSRQLLDLLGTIRQLNAAARQAGDRRALGGLGKQLRRIIRVHEAQTLRLRPVRERLAARPASPMPPR